MPEHSILISCLGLFGMITHVAESKTKEIGIRKVFGSNVSAIVWLLIKEFLILVTVSASITFPMAYYFIEQILQTYAYRISTGWEIFFATLTILIALTLLTVGWKARRAATVNPLKSILSCE